MRLYIALSLILSFVFVSTLALPDSLAGSKAQQTLRTLQLGLKHRNSLLPISQGVWISETVEYSQQVSPEQGKGGLPSRAILTIIRFVQTETGYWKQTYQQFTTPHGTSARHHSKFFDGNWVYRVLPVVHEIEADAPTDYEQRVHIYPPTTPADEVGFCDLMGTVRGAPRFLAQRIESGSPKLVGSEQIGGLPCYIIESSHGDVSSRYWVCVGKDYAILKRSETAPEGLYEYSETAQHLSTLDGVAVVTATSVLKRCRTRAGPGFVCVRGATRFEHLRACSHSGYVDALKVAIMPLGVHWFNRATTESGEVGHLRELKRIMSNLRTAEELVRKHAEVGPTFGDEQGK